MIRSLLALPRRPNTGVFQSAVRRLGSAAALEPESSAQSDVSGESIDRLVGISHCAIDVRVRSPGKAEIARLRRQEKTRIPGVLQGCGEFPDVLLDVPEDDIAQIYEKELITKQRLGSGKFTGPPVVLRLHAADDAAVTREGQSVAHPPRVTVRAVPCNILLDPLSMRPVSVGFVSAPSSQSTRVRVPMRGANEERCPGLRDGGWFNRLHREVDVIAPPGVRPPEVVTADLTGLGVKDNVRFSSLEFDGKDQGTELVLPGDTVGIVISKV